MAGQLSLSHLTLRSPRIVLITCVTGFKSDATRSWVGSKGRMMLRAHKCEATCLCSVDIKCARISSPQDGRPPCSKRTDEVIKADWWRWWHESTWIQWSLTSSSTVGEEGSWCT